MNGRTIVLKWCQNSVRTSSLAPTSGCDADVERIRRPGARGPAPMTSPTPIQKGDNSERVKINVRKIIMNIIFINVAIRNKIITSIISRPVPAMRSSPRRRLLGGSPAGLALALSPADRSPSDEDDDDDEDEDEDEDEDKNTHLYYK